MIVNHTRSEILLQHRSDTNNWGIPGGFMELGETTEETARREVLEETGLTAGDLKLLNIFSGKEFYFKYPNGDEVYNVIVCYITNEVSGTLQADHEGLDLKYFKLNALPKDIISTSRKMLEYLIGS